MAYQNINQYNFRRWGIKPVNEVTDICLASDEKDYDQEVADKVEGFVEDFRKTEVKDMSGKKLQEIFDTIFPFIKQGQATGRVGFGLPHKLTSQGRPMYVGNGMKKAMRPSNDIIHIDFEKGSIPKVGLDGTKKKKKGLKIKTLFFFSPLKISGTDI